jgi:hypothetical protein
MSDSAVMRMAGRVWGSFYAGSGASTVEIIHPIAMLGVCRWLLRPLPAMMLGVTFVTPATLGQSGPLLAFCDGLAEFVAVRRQDWGYVERKETSDETNHPLAVAIDN